MNNMRIALYPRVSTKEQAREGYSIKEQIDRLSKYCDAKDWEIYRIYTDGGYSGADMERPALQELIKDAKQGRFDAVLVYKLDRLSRSQKDTLELIEDIFLPNNVNFISMTENFDTSTPFGRAMVGILSVFAQLEREQIKERMSIGIEGRAKDGKWHGSKFTPVGYEYKDGELEIIEHEAMIVRKAFEMFNKRIPINRICKELMDKGLKHRYGYYVPPTLKNALRNKVYIGYINHDGDTYKGNHESIIDDETFANAQRIFEERNRNNPHYKNAFKYSSTLSGLLICKHCGSKYCKQAGWKRANGEYNYYYICNSRGKKNKKLVKNDKCRNKNWRMKDLDNLIFNEITKLSLDPKYIDEIKEATRDNENPLQVDIIEKRISELTTQISRFTDLYSLGELDIEEIKTKIDPLTSERSKLKAEIEQLQRASDITTEQTYKVVSSFGEVLERGELEEIRFTIEELIELIILDDEKITIKWNFA